MRMQIFWLLRFRDWCAARTNAKVRNVTGVKALSDGAIKQ
jgi:hypothetical protein